MLKWLQSIPFLSTTHFSTTLIPTDCMTSIPTGFLDTVCIQFVQGVTGPITAYKFKTPAPNPKPNSQHTSEHSITPVTKTIFL